MTRRENEYGQPIGFDLGEWQPPGFPEAVSIEGQTVTLEPLSVTSHGAGLWDALGDAPASLWTYMSFGPFADRAEFESMVESMARRRDWVPYAFLVGDTPLGFASYLRIEPEAGVIEVGSIVLSPELQRTTAATESLYLLIRRTFQLGYRRCEWKCDSLNQPSRLAAERLGFTFEGTFRQAIHYKGRNRDTAWYSIVDGDWPDLDRAFRSWLSPANFDERGKQIRSLKEMRQTS